MESFVINNKMKIKLLVVAMIFAGSITYLYPNYKNLKTEAYQTRTEVATNLVQTEATKNFSDDKGLEFQGLLASDSTDTILETVTEMQSDPQQSDLSDSIDTSQTASTENSDANSTQSQEPIESESVAPKKEVSLSTGLTIALVADAHAGQSQGFQVNNGLASVLGGVGPDIVVDLGDFIDNRKDYKKIKKSEAIADFKKTNGAIARMLPIYHTIGNHEVFSLSKNDIKSLTGRNNYYSFAIKGYNIIILDANYTASEKTIDVAHENILVYTGTLPGKQLDWLKNQLKKNKRNIIFIHHPVYNLTNSEEVKKIIKDNNDRIVFIANGHKHPETMRVSRFGEVKNYDIPSAYFQRSYAIATINGGKEIVSAKKY